MLAGINVFDARLDLARELSRAGALPVCAEILFFAWKTARSDDAGQDSEGRKLSCIATASCALLFAAGTR